MTRFIHVQVLLNENERKIERDRERIDSHSSYGISKDVMRRYEGMCVLRMMIIILAY